jgi:hypothetical protein
MIITLIIAIFAHAGYNITSLNDKDDDYENNIL